MLPTREKRRLDRPEGIVMLNSLQDLHNVRFRHGLSSRLLWRVIEDRSLRRLQDL